MKKELIESADIIGMFCRLNLNIKRELPIRTSEMGVLIYIKKSHEKVTPLAISNYFRISKPSVTAMIKALVEESFLEKVSSETDKRSYSLQITAKGNALVKKTFDEYMKILQLLDEEMDEGEFIEMIRLIDKANGIINAQKGLF